MADNAGTTVEAITRVTSLSHTFSEEELARKTNEYLNLFANIIDCPRDQLILRNAITTILEMPEYKFSIDGVYKLLTQDQARADAAKKLSEAIPNYWSKEWDSSWRKDADPLMSLEQQRMTSITRLVNFWSKEWSDIPSDIVDQLVAALKKMER